MIPSNSDLYTTGTGYLFSMTNCQLLFAFQPGYLVQCWREFIFCQKEIIHNTIRLICHWQQLYLIKIKSVIWYNIIIQELFKVDRTCHYQSSNHQIQYHLAFRPHEFTAKYVHNRKCLRIVFRKSWLILSGIINFHTISPYVMIILMYLKMLSIKCWPILRQKQHSCHFISKIFKFMFSYENRCFYFFI